MPISHREISQFLISLGCEALPPPIMMQIPSAKLDMAASLREPEM